MEELILDAFLHADAIGPLVRDGKYDIFGPDGKIIPSWQWHNRRIKPNMKFSMRLWSKDKVDLSGRHRRR
jgi:hypothetical protein